MKGKNAMTTALPTNEAPAWQQTLMEAAYNGVTANDMKEIVEGIVKRAKTGSEKDVRLLFDYVLGAKSPTKIVNQTIVMQDVPEADTATKARPGSVEKIAAMSARYQNGKGLFHGNDE